MQARYGRNLTENWIKTKDGISDDMILLIVRINISKLVKKGFLI